MSSLSTPHNGDENRQGGIVVTAFITAVVASVVVALRMVTRIRIVRSVGWDDYAIVLATFGQIIGCGLVLVEVHYGFGRHRFYLSQSQYTEFQKYAFGEWIQTFQTLMFNKVSICCFLLRIPVQKYFIRPIQIAIFVLVTSNVVLTLLWILQCNPVVAKAWNKKAPGSCLSDGQLQRIIISQAIISIISDFMLALFPIVLLWRVHISLRQKSGLCVLMGLGLITAACCIVRTVMNWQNISSDPTWSSIDNWYWRSWEVCIGISAACIPALLPGYRTVSAGLSSYFTYRTKRGSRSTETALIGTKNLALRNPKDRGYTSLSIPTQARLAKHAPGLRAAKEAASAEADHAEVYGAGEDFTMNALPGDKKTGNQGIRKSTTIDVSEARVRAGSGRSPEEEDLEKGPGRIDFVE